MTSKIIDCNIDPAKQYANASAAMKRLTSAGFRLYSYLWSMAQLEGGKSVFQLCQNDACTFTGLCARSYYTAVNDLIDHEYIKPKAGKRRYFLFSGEGR